MIIHHFLFIPYYVALFSNIQHLLISIFQQSKFEGLLAEVQQQCNEEKQSVSFDIQQYHTLNCTGFVYIFINCKDLQEVYLSFYYLNYWLNQLASLVLSITRLFDVQSRLLPLLFVQLRSTYVEYFTLIGIFTCSVMVCPLIGNL